MKEVYPDATQPWCDEDAGALGWFNNVELYFNLLQCNGPARGYYPDTIRSILIMYTENIKAGKLFGARHGFKVCMGAYYFGVNIGYEKPKRDWLKYQMNKWERDVCAATKTVGKYSQEI